MSAHQNILSAGAALLENSSECPSRYNKLTSALFSWGGTEWGREPPSVSEVTACSRQIVINHVVITLRLPFEEGAVLRGTD